MSLFDWTGNPFVDTGLAVAVIRANKSSPSEMSMDDFKNVIGDGKWLASANVKLNSYRLLFANGFLNCSQVGKIKDGTELRKYERILTALKDHLDHEQIGPDNVSNNVCECTGVFLSANSFLQKLTQSLKKENILRDNQKLDLGRNAFPLLGSIGNDAGMMPAASREPNVSSFALLCIQMASLVAVIMRGKIVMFQYTEPDLLIDQVRPIYQETIQKLETSSKNDKIAAKGTQQGSKTIAHLLLNQLDKFQKKKKYAMLPNSLSLNLWLVVNSGTSYDCELIEIPNHSLQFLYEAMRHHLTEIKKLLDIESNRRPDQQLLECISKKKDYSPLYPYKTIPTSKELFALYQIEVLDRPILSLQVAEWIAVQLKERLQEGKDKKLLIEFTKHLGDYRDAKKCKPKIKKLMTQMAEEGNLSYDEYSALFPIIGSNPIKIDSFGWKFIWFYLNHEELNNQRPQFIEASIMSYENKFRKIIKQFAEDVYDWYTSKHGKDNFHRKILEGFKNNKIPVSRLQQWFCNLAELPGKEHYTNEAWDELCRDENNNNRIYEVRFQLWLELANLYRNNN